MSVAAAAFKKWASQAQLPGNTGALARAVGISRPTLQAQYVRGRVQEWILIKAARVQRLDPVRALAAFEEYSDVTAPNPPLLTEVLSQVTMDDALAELLRRRQPERASAAAALHIWPDPPIPGGVRQWIDAIDTGTLRGVLGERLGIASSNLSAQITSNKLTAQGLAETARIAGLSPINGFAVAGLLTLEEAGWSPLARQDAVAGLRDSALFDLIGARISYAQRFARRREADDDDARRIQDTLG